MLDGEFLLKLSISFVVGAAWITCTTVVAERFGARIGGVIGGVPSTVVIALVFIALTQSTQGAVDATTAIPFFAGVYGPFVVVYVWVGRRAGLAGAVLIALLVWLALTIAVIEDGHEDVVVSIVACVVLVSGSYVALRRLGGFADRVTPVQRVSPAALLNRAALSGSIIVGAVVVARAGGAVIGGAVAAFPAVIVSTMVITWTSRGRQFSNSVVSVLMVSASINVSVYAVATRYLYPLWGLVLGTVAAFAASLCSAYVVYRVLGARAPSPLSLTEHVSAAPQIATPPSARIEP